MRIFKRKDNDDNFAENSHPNSNYYGNNRQNNFRGYNNQFNNYGEDDSLANYYSNNQYNSNYNSQFNNYYGNGNQNNFNQGYNNQFNNYYGNNNQNSFNQGYNRQFNNYYGNRGYNNEFNQDFNNQNDYFNHSKKKVIVFTLMCLFILIFIILSVFAVINLMKSYEVSFELNGATKINTPPESCKSNIFGNCYVTLPEAKRENGEVIGYSLKANSKTPEYQVGEKIELLEDTKLYVVSKSVKKVNIDTSSIDEIENNDVSCTVYNNEEKCKVTLPYFNKKGYLNVGYSKNKGSTTASSYPGDTYLLKEDVTIYPVYVKYVMPNSNISVDNISRTEKLQNVYVDVSSTCSSSIADKVVKYLKVIEGRYPFIFKNTKVTLVSPSEFHKYTNTGSSTKGVTIYSPSLADTPYVFLPCEENETDIYPVMFHELMHVFDFRTLINTKTSMSNDQSLLDAANKYLRTSNRPLRAYAYSNIREFFAELLTYYYFSYVETSYSAKGTVTYKQNLPSDLKALAEKYLCIGKNNFDRSKC